MTDTLPPSNSTTPTTPPSGMQPTGGMAKETGPHISFAEAPLIQEVGQEMPLPQEVVKAGVTIQPTTVTLPPSIQSMGVKTVGQPAAAVLPQAPTVQLPLSDEQIAQGLHQSIKSSWRWLAEWCKRQLMHTHIILNSVQGKTTRTSVK